MNRLITKEREQFDKRIHEIDLFRGFLIILVMFDHLMWFINYYIFKYNSPALTWYWTSEARYYVRQIVLYAFMFTCGISCHFSKNNKRRGLLLLALAIFITLGTHLAQLLPVFNNRVIIIDFNILGVIALSILLFVLVEKRSNKDTFLIVGALVAFYIFVLVSIYTFNGEIEYNAFRSILYSPFNPIKEGYVGDYLSLFPYVIFLFLGVIFARYFYKNKQSLIPHKGNWERPFCLLGRHTLIIYIAHELLFTLIFTIIGLII